MREIRHVLSVVGARPNFMKTAPVISALARRPDPVRHTLVHTGQHYDDAMSKTSIVPSPSVSRSAAAAFTRPPLATSPARAGRGRALERIACLSCAAVADGTRAASSAATPATCGAAIEVPLLTQYAGEPRQVEVIWSPGAATSTLVAPQFE